MKTLKLLVLASLFLSLFNAFKYDKFVYSFEGDVSKTHMSIKDLRKLRLIINQMQSQGFEFVEKCDTAIIICEYSTDWTEPINIYYKSITVNNIPRYVESKYSLLLNEDMDEFHEYYLSADRSFEGYEIVYKLICSNGKISKISFMAHLSTFVKWSEYNRFRYGLENLNEEQHRGYKTRSNNEVYEND